MRRCTSARRQRLHPVLERSHIVRQVRLTELTEPGSVGLHVPQPVNRRRVRLQRLTRHRVRRDLHASRPTLLERRELGRDQHVAHQLVDLVLNRDHIRDLRTTLTEQAGTVAELHQRYHAQRVWDEVLTLDRLPHRAQHIEATVATTVGPVLVQRDRTLGLELVDPLREVHVRPDIAGPLVDPRLEASRTLALRPVLVGDEALARMLDRDLRLAVLAVPHHRERRAGLERRRVQHLRVSVEAVLLPDTPRVLIARRVVAHTEALDVKALLDGIDHKRHPVVGHAAEHRCELLPILRRDEAQRVVAVVVVLERPHLRGANHEATMQLGEPPDRAM